MATRDYSLYEISVEDVGRGYAKKVYVAAEDIPHAVRLFNSDSGNSWDNVDLQEVRRVGTVIVEVNE